MSSDCKTILCGLVIEAESADVWLLITETFSAISCHTNSWPSPPALPLPGSDGSHYFAASNDRASSLIVPLSSLSALFLVMMNSTLRSFQHSLWHLWCSKLDLIVQPNFRRIQMWLSLDTSNRFWGTPELKLIEGQPNTTHHTRNYILHVDDLFQILFSRWVL